MLNEKSRQIKTWIQNISFIFLLLGVFSFRLNDVKIRPLDDEAYHITDRLVTSSYWDFNVFQKDHYLFFGHPLGYPLSLKASFSLLGPTSQTARIHALAFSFMTLFAFFLIAREFLWFPAAALITLALYSSTAFYKLTPAILGDMSFLMFSLFTIYFLYREKFWSAALTAFLAAFFREAAVALGMGIFCSYALLRAAAPKNLPGFKKILWVALPGLVFLAAFFVHNEIQYGTFSRHPYALGTLSHTHVHFFAWGATKLQELYQIKYFLLKNFPAQFLFWLIFSFSYLIFKKKIRRPFPFFCFAFFSAFVLLFFSIYGDTIVRDILPVICFLFFLLAYSLQSFSRPLQAVAAAAILAFGVSRLTVFEQAQRAETYKKIAEFIEQNYAEKKIYAHWPISSLGDKIHGYFSHPPLFRPLSSPDLDVMIIDSRTGPVERQAVSEALQRREFRQTRQVNIMGRLLTVYEKPSD